MEGGAGVNDQWGPHSALADRPRNQ